MFEPKYSISEKLLASVVRIERVLELFKTVKIQEQTLERIKKDIKHRKIHAILRFGDYKVGIEDIKKMTEDEPYRDERVDEVAERSGVKGKEKDLQMVMNVYYGMKFVDQMVYLSNKFGEVSFGDKDLVGINSLLGERMVEKSLLGAKRTGMETGQGGSYFTLSYVTPVEIPFQMNDFWRWFASAEKQIYGLFYAAISVYEILRIAPMEKDNGITAVMLGEYLLQKLGYGLDGCLDWQEDLLKNKEMFWMKMKEVEKSFGDMTVWIEFFVSSVEMAAERLRLKTMASMGELPAFKTTRKKEISLSQRQTMILEDLTLRGFGSLKEIKSILPEVSEDTVLRDLKDLMEKKLVKKKGKTKGAVYVLGKLERF